MATEEFDFMKDHFVAAGIEVTNEDTTSGEESTSGTSTESGNEGESSVSGQAGTDSVEGTAGKDSAGDNADGGKKSGKEEKGQGTDKTQDLKPGDIKLQDGTVVRAGQERRWYDSMNVARQREQVARNELNTAKQNLQNLQTKYEAIADSVKNMGFEQPEHYVAAARLYKDLQTDPVKVVTSLLAELKTKGYSIEGLGGAVDTRAIEHLIDRKLTTSETNQSQQQQQAVAEEIDKEVQNFVRDFPDGLMHENEIGNLIKHAYEQRGVELSLQEAYFLLKERVIADGLDWGQPLGPQIQAKRQQQQQQPPQNQNGQSTSNAPRPSGRVLDSGAEEIDPAKIIQPESNRSDDIIKAAMRENGFKV